jgi:hypothetical protein
MSFSPPDGFEARLKQMADASVTAIKALFENTV